jgi:cytochrome c553
MSDGSLACRHDHTCLLARWRWWSEVRSTLISGGDLFTLRPFVLALVIFSGGSVCVAGDVKTGRAKALMCQTCHGIDGLSKVPDAPNIAGQPESYLVAQLQAFKSGARKGEAMSLVAPALADKDIEDLAAYFSAIEIKVIKIPD